METAANDFQATRGNFIPPGWEIKGEFSSKKRGYLTANEGRSAQTALFARSWGGRVECKKMQLLMIEAVLATGYVVSIAPLNLSRYVKM